MSNLRVVDRPRTSQLRSDGTLSGGWWHDVDHHRMVCDLCPRACNLKPGDRGFCFVRQNIDGEMVLTTYGKSTGFCIDPIEKKPLNHFYPGTSVLSFGTAGCNLGCKFCQNHDISKARKVELLSEHAMPHTIAKAAVELGCQSVAYTYNDPIIWAEYAIDTAKACRQVGVKSVAVTAGYITPQARAPFFEFFDAANVDLKAFTEDFYEHVTLSHLQPILDTLRWLKEETDIWFEITNLIIPDANDSADELQQLCDWVLHHLGDEVPIHFSAFHPDFRMLDRPPTPHETLLRAHEIARKTGLKYVYVGNVHDADHQSTYCRSCGQLVVERDWYQLGAYHLNHDRCVHCGDSVPGRFADAPGDWGRKRQPIQISSFAVEPQVENTSQGGKVSNTFESDSLPLVDLGPDQQTAVLAATCELVASAVTGRTCALLDSSLAGIADLQVMGVYVSLKRQGRLRGCCGFTGAPVQLMEGLRYSAPKTALEDPRLPPVSPTELAALDVEVWLLQGLIPVDAAGANREHEIKVGRDGLVVQRGEQRGLLLPGVATDNNWDAATFLRQVCVKAQLPPTAWRETDTKLLRFEGIKVAGAFDPEVLQRTSSQASSVVDHHAVQLLAEFCRQNVDLLIRGALPNYYLQDVSDGMVHGIVLEGRHANGTTLNASRISLRPPMPLQSTLFVLSEELVKSIQQTQLPAEEWQVNLAILEDPAMQGSTRQPDLRGTDSDRGLLIIAPNSATAWQFDNTLSFQSKLAQLNGELALRRDQTGNVYSFHVSATAAMTAVNRVQPLPGDSIRQPAVAGSFYPAESEQLAAAVQSLLPNPLPKKERWRAAMVPHAGLRFSGRIAANVLARLDFPSSVIVIGPKHTRHGVDWSVAPHQTWSLPGIEVANDSLLASQLVENIEYLQPDAAAHQAEHAIEVELPFLHHFAPKTKVVGIAIGSGSLEACQIFAAGLAKTLREWDQDVMLLISSDMNHFASDSETRRLDELAIQALERMDPEHLFRTIRENEISMCGLLPAVIALYALRDLRPLQKTARVGYATSADVTGDTSRVVGYAGMLFG